MKSLFTYFVCLLFCSLPALSQVVIAPNLVTTNVGQFNGTCPVENLILDLDASVTETTEFPYEITTSFTSSGIGYISSFSTTGILTFEFDSPFDVVDMLVWQAYFTIETNHSINSCEVFYFDDLNNNLGSDVMTVPIASLADDLPFVMPLTPTSNVSKIELHVYSLHGGNEISLRRIAFRGLDNGEGCTDSTACNYDSTATIEDGSCEYDGCDCLCIDENGNDVCDIDEILGCTDSTAINYHVAFSIDDGSCIYSQNYCGPGTVWDDTQQVCIPLADPCPGDFDNNGIVATSDLLIFLTLYGNAC